VGGWAVGYLGSPDMIPQLIEFREAPCDCDERQHEQTNNAIGIIRHEWNLE
jgi:hypothetical protein